MSDLTPQERAVFGAGAVRGPDGKIIETGRGAPGNRTVQHEQALARDAKNGIPAEGALKDLADLFKASTDDKANLARVQKLTAAADAARKAMVAAEGEQRKLDKQRLDHIAKMASERAAHEAAIEADREAVEVEREKKLADLVAREADVAKREKELAGLLKAHSDRVAELDQKLAAIQRAAR
jgi:hypothetical protein